MVRITDFHTCAEGCRRCCGIFRKVEDVGKARREMVENDRGTSNTTATRLANTNIGFSLVQLARLTSSHQLNVTRVTKSNH
ncbi:hypothetical protein RRG08_059044 [Elysia crispata]|uniref:Uncharacterized protein n=1 Tax=Elysia crispata TaxID=231223 RepID=A0AAE1DE90_9GAST|nr:hypothetical protein RRG08_059044 [Elysia crispata]